MQAAPVEGPSRKIAYKGADPSVGKLPVNPDDLMWRGQPAITTQQLQRMGDEIMTRSRLKNSGVQTRSKKKKD